MIYLLDANVLMDANRDFYNLERVKEFWEWLAYVGRAGKAKIPDEQYDEITDGSDELATWAKDISIKADLLLTDDVDEKLVRHVIDKGYAPDLDDVELEKLGRDPFLIAHALSDASNRMVVTTEVSKPSKKRGNKHIPDVCDFLGVTWCDGYKFFKDMDFRTDWETNP